jgi:hypothetical protein
LRIGGETKSLHFFPEQMHISRASTKQPQPSGHVPDTFEIPFIARLFKCVCEEECVTLIKQSKINRKQSRIFVNNENEKCLDWVHYWYKTFHTL